ncbi:response regulator [Parapedobacter sp. SGR-10]|uniref:hybrid sensor histidine kinase/response regulator transcription factor n=1 Tax=Parapedobacter sp. SGR-10 TaxID=2710879 RepID=UPI0013D69EEA|nr:two-component regulator propeller domain-containing protein [Parapedobacter sp. SGR-10]NGF56945.1 response regulator [Parapedobacter sp. SGR-10]
MVWFVLIAMPLSMFGQAQLLFRHYTVEQNFSSNFIRAILQDSTGYMWFATKRGLDRFDGIRVKTYRHDESVPGSIDSDFIQSFAQISDSTIWVATNRGISILNLRTDRFSTFPPLKGVLVYDITKDKRGRVWIATHGKGVFCFDPKTEKLRSFDTTLGALAKVVPATKIIEDKQGRIWVATETRGIIVLDSDLKRVKYYSTANSDLPSNNILTLYQDRAGTIWVGTMNAGLARFDTGEGRFTVYQKGGKAGLNNNIVRTIYQPSPDKLFVGTEEGLNVLDIEKDSFRSYTRQYNNENSISDNAIYAIYGDFEGGIWIGTYFGGVNYLHQPPSGIERYLPTGNPRNLSGGAVACFLEDRLGNMWIGTEDAGLNYFDSKSKEFRRYPFLKSHQPLPYHNIHALTRDSRGLIWIGTFSGGLSVLDPVRNSMKTYRHRPNDATSLNSNSINFIYEDSEQQIWIGTSDGVNKYDPVSDSFVRIGNMEKYAIYGIHEDAQKIMWFVSNNFGMQSYNKRTGQWQQFTAENQEGALSSPKVITLLDDKKGNLWIGTEGGGLNRFSLKTKRAEVIGEEEGLPAKIIYSLVLDQKGYLWIATEKGLYSLDTSNGMTRHYSIWDGAKSLIFNYKSIHQAKDGKIYIGGINGFGVFHPDSIRNMNVIPRIVLSNLQIFNRDISPHTPKSPLSKALTYTDKIVLNHDQTVINIEYAGLSYISPEKINYSYKLEGLDEDWNHVGNQQRVSYSNLPPGKYTFRIKADVGYQSDDLSETVLHIVVRPPFYKTSLAYILYALIVSGILLWLRHSFIKKHKRENEIRLERLRIKNEKEFYNQKIEFFTMMAHEVRTPLSLISGPVEKMLESDTLGPEVRSQLEMVNKSTNRLTTLVDQLLDFRRIESDFYKLNPENIDVVPLVRNICTTFASAARHHRGLNFAYSSDVEHLIVHVDVEALTKILNNLIVNALKFARSIVSVHLRIEEGEEGYFLAVDVEDDGIGIPAGELENIFKKFFKVNSGKHQYNNLGGSGIGLALAKALTEKSGGDMKVISNEGERTVFTMLIPCHSLEQESELEKLEDDIRPEYEGEASILVVEDDDDLQHFIASNLRAEGYSVSTATGGNEALEVLVVHDINLIISDIMMPDMDGTELCKKIKDNIAHSHIPVILLTAKTDSNTELEGIESGADIYMTKPFKIRHLTATVKNLLESRARLKQKFATYPFASESQSSIVPTKDQSFIEKIVKFIEENISDPSLSVEDISLAAAMSKSAFQRKMKALTGYTPNEFTRLIRLQYAAKLLMSNEYRVSEIGYMCGFSSHSYFSKCFFNHFHITPSDFMDKQFSEKGSTGE